MRTFVSTYLKICFDSFFFTKVLNYESELFDVMYIAIMNGHLELAGKIMEKAVDNGGYGFNFLHKEVLVNKNQPLTPFKAASVTKKTYLAKKVLI